MRTIPVVEFKSHLSAMLAAVELGEDIAITRHGKIVARLVPEQELKAADVFRPFWAEADEIDLIAPQDIPPCPVSALD